MGKETDRKRNIFLAIWLGLIVIILAAVFAVGSDGEKSESVRELMRDGVLHENNKISFFGLSVNPAVISAYAVSAVLIFAAALIRIIAVPKFTEIPGKFQLVLEEAVGFFSRMAASNSPHKTKFVGAYIFGAGVYIFFSTVFELLGVQAITQGGISVSLPAPIADINGAIAVGVCSYLVILFAGLFTKGIKGLLGALKDFSLPVSMSFRLFGALLSGLLVTELVYYYTSLSFVLPVFVGVMFTLLHAAIQTYVLTTLVSIFYGESVEPINKKQAN